LIKQFNNTMDLSGCKRACRL